MSQRIAERFTAAGPKRILSLDGGGSRGMISIGFLERMEDILRKRHGRNDYVLADYFDLIGGTSVGSMLATMLALGWDMKTVREEFWRCCPKIFGRNLIGRGFFRSRFSHEGLQVQLERILGDTRLESNDFKTGLAIVAKRLDTGSAWVMFNNPNQKYWEELFNPDTGETAIGNRAYRVADLIRASTAAPTYFKPHKIRIHERAAGKHPDHGMGYFVDGGMSPYNDPSLLLLMMAGIQGYCLGGKGKSWELGEDKLLIMSIGTGEFRFKINKEGFSFAALLGSRALLSMMADNQATTLKTMQWLARSKRPWMINSEVEDLSQDDLGVLLGSRHSVLSFTRYNVKLERPWLEKELGLHHFSDARINRMRRLDNMDALHTYYSLSQFAAEKQVSEDDFPWQFNNPKCG